MRQRVLCGFLAGLALAMQCFAAHARETVELTARDGMRVAADVYLAETEMPRGWIVLAHQAGSSRGEYREIAPRLNALGFHAIALDQRSGRAFGGVTNQTAQRAQRAGKRQSYAAARPDIEAGLVWARDKAGGQPVILWGSSYSAALALLIAGEAPKLVDGIVSMSPGEYIRGQSIKGAAARIKAPVFIASAANETGRWRSIYSAIPGQSKTGFAPPRGGRHGSSAFILARNGATAAAYWDAVTRFLDRHFR